MIAPFTDRYSAGQQLGRELHAYAHRPDVVVLGLPRGGVPVAFEVAQALDAPLDVFIVRKLGLPGREELAMGALASGGTLVLNDEVLRDYGVSMVIVDQVREMEQRELERREHLYRGDRPPPELKNKTVIVVDDGLATGATMLAAVRALRHHHPARIIVAVPTGASETIEMLRRHADDVVALTTPDPFYAVGQWYKDFSPTSDGEVRDLLERWDSAHAHAGRVGPGTEDVH
jgi:putative phosphoribosyl transferase